MLHCTGNARRYGKETVAFDAIGREFPALTSVRSGAVAILGRGDMLAQGFWGWLLIGLVAGILGKMLMPGRDPGGFIVTILIGIAGALLGGYLAPLIGWTPDATWERYAAATAGAVILLALYRLVVARRVR